MSFTESAATVVSRALFRSPRSLILGIGAGLVLLGATLPDKYFGFYLLVIGAVVLMLGVSFEFFVYLQESRRRFLRDRAYYERQYARASSSESEDSLKEMNKKLSDIQAVGFKSELEVAELVKIQDRILIEQHLSAIRVTANKTQKRLAEEVNALGSRANSQLFFGIFISMTGLAVLGYFVFTIPSDLFVKGKKLEFVGYFVARFSLVAFIEIFAYFFLRLYRYSIFEIKHFQNEMTNAEFRVIALEAALMKGDEGTLNKLCEDLAKTERNFILKRGEKTITQTLLDSEANRDKSLAAAVEKMVRSVGRSLPAKEG